MGVLANAFVRAFLGPTGSGYNGDGSPYSPATPDAAALGQAIDNAIPNAQDLATLEANQTGLQEQISQNNNDRITAQKSFQAQINNNTNAITVFEEQIPALYAATADLSTDGAAAKSAIAALQGTFDALTDPVSGVAAVTAATLAALQVNASLSARPGDVPAAFTTDLAAGLSGVPSGALPIVGPNGRALRIPGAFVLAPVALCPMEPNRSYLLRTALRRSTDTTDPAGDAIQFAVAWYGADGNRLALPLTDLATQRLTVTMGRTCYEAIVSLNPPPAPADPYVRPVVPVPPGAAYCRSVLIGYGATPVHDVEVIAASDITDRGAVSVDVDSLNARISAIAAALNLSI